MFYLSHSNEALLDNSEPIPVGFKPLRTLRGGRPSLF